MEVWRLCRSRSALSVDALWNSPQPALAVTQGRIEEARETLTTIGTPEPEQEMEAIVASIHLDTSSRKEPLFKRKYRVDRFMTGLRPVALS